jgi:hypothetical protein
MPAHCGLTRRRCCPEYGGRMSFMPEQSCSSALCRPGKDKHSAEIEHY